MDNDKEPQQQQQQEKPDDRRPPFIVKSYRDKDDRYGVEVGAGWRIGNGGIAITFRDGIAVTGRVIAWPRKDGS